MGKKYGFSFSWRRATGLSAAKGRLSRQIGIPLTRSGRERKVGRIVGSWPLAFSGRGKSQSKVQVTEAKQMGCLGKLITVGVVVVVAVVVIGRFVPTASIGSDGSASVGASAPVQAPQVVLAGPADRTSIAVSGSAGKSLEDQLGRTEAMLNSDVADLRAAEDAKLGAIASGPGYPDAAAEKEAAAQAARSAAAGDGDLDLASARLMTATQDLSNLKMAALSTPDIATLRSRVNADEDSLVALLARKRVAVVAADAKERQQEVSSGRSSSAYRSNSSGDGYSGDYNYSGGGTYVRGYTRRDGTYVNGYTRRR